MKRSSYFIAAADYRTDVLAADLILALKEKYPSLSAIGIGGAAMQRAGLQTCVTPNFSASSGFEFSEMDQRNILEFIDRSQPRLVILTPGFEHNQKLFESIMLRGLPVVYYGAPRAFLWHDAMWQTFKSCRPKVLGYFPFESKLFSAHDIPYEFVGNPLRDRMAKISVDLSTLQLKRTGESWLLFKCPQEISDFRTFFPLFWRMANAFAQQAEQWTAIVNIPSHLEPVAAELGGRSYMTASTKENVRVYFDMANELTQISDLAVTTGGIDGFEVAMMETPAIAITREEEGLERNWPRFGCLVNAVLGQAVMPEIKLGQASELLLDRINYLLSHSDDLIRQRQTYRDMRRNLSGFAAENASVWIGDNLLTPAKRT